MYGEDDLGSLPLFGGGFINFGFWLDRIQRLPDYFLDDVCTIAI